MTNISGESCFIIIKQTNSTGFLFQSKKKVNMQNEEEKKTNRKRNANHQRERENQWLKKIYVCPKKINRNETCSGSII